MDPLQLDLFTAGTPAAKSCSSQAPRLTVAVGDMNDEALLSAIPGAGMMDTIALAGEAGRRKLAAAVPALEAVCRLLTGFGADAPVAEQVAALEALGAIGGSAAVNAVARVIARKEVQGPTLVVAMSVAAALGVSLAPETALALLRHADPVVRADACRSARSHAEVVAVMVELLDDLNPQVHVAAACALGRMGRPETLPVLVRLLQRTPTAEVIDAVASVADDDAIVLLGRLARTRPELQDAILDSLDGCGLDLAEKVAAGLRRTPSIG